MIMDDENLHEDYEVWVQNLFSKMANKMYADDYIGEYLHDNSTWISEKFKNEVTPHLYGDTLSEELESLLQQLFEVLTTDDEFFSFGQLDNATWMEEKLTDFKNNSKGLSSSIDGYYEAWHNEM